MCQAFSCIVDSVAKVTWKLGVDSHTDLLAGAPYKDSTADPAKMEFARVEITPNNGSYLEPDAWTLRVNQAITPVWFAEKHKSAVHAAHKKWLAKIDKILVRKKIVHPFKIVPPAKINKKHINMLRSWASVWDSVPEKNGGEESLPATVRTGRRRMCGCGPVEGSRCRYLVQFVYC